MKKFLLSLAFALPVFAFYSCGGDDNDAPAVGDQGGEEFETHDGNGPIEEPILAFYDSPASIMQMEKRKKIMDEENELVHVLGYYGATSATAITYTFSGKEMTSATASFDAKNNGRVIDYISGKYVPVEEEHEVNDLCFETKDHLTEVHVITTEKQTSVFYSRPYSKEEEESKFQEPVLAWGEELDHVKKNEVRPFDDGSNGVYTFLGGEYAGDATYVFLAPFGLASVSLTDIPGHHWEKTIDKFKKDYKEVTATPGSTFSFVSEERNAKIEVVRLLRSSFNVSYYCKDASVAID